MAVAEAPGSGASPVDESPLVEARHLTKRYDAFVAVDDLSFAVGRGEIYGLLGPNGAGKTTTILMLLGLSEPTSGEARVLNLDPARDPLEVKRHVGYLPDSVGFYGRLSGRENLDYTARLNGIEPGQADARIEELLEQVRLTDAGDKPTDTYSRGMLQRLGVADALVKDPSILILDEPTTSIDPAGVAELLDLIRSLVRDRGLAVLLSSHLLSQVERLCDRVGIFSHGRLVAEGPVHELAERAGDAHLSLDEVYRRLEADAEEDADDNRD
jgi:ABC-2 type transport system ATP-binding protein